MRTLSELLKLIKEHYQSLVLNRKQRGLCGTVSDLFSISIITFDEMKVLRVYIDDNCPENSGHGMYWYDNDWTIAVESQENIEKRVKWLDKHIKLNEDGNKSILELLILVQSRYKEYIKESTTLCSGLCGMATISRHRNLINNIEYKTVVEYIRKNRPKDSGSSSYWYNTNKEEFIQKRLDWLDDHIKLNGGDNEPN